MSFEDDKFFKHYEDFEKSKIKWSGDKYTAVVGLPAGYSIYNTAYTASTKEGLAVHFTPNYFYSEYMTPATTTANTLDYYNSYETQVYKGVQFHFHAKSEHTIDGIQFDFEMHTVHYASLNDAAGLQKTSKGILGAVQGIIFDTKHYDKSVTKAEKKIIDNFFDSLKFD